MPGFQSPFFQKQLTDNAKGTALKGVYLKTLHNLKIPLAPLQEQERIVSKEESLFSELDQADHSLDNLCVIASLRFNQCYFLTGKDSRGIKT